MELHSQVHYDSSLLIYLLGFIDVLFFDCGMKLMEFYWITLTLGHLANFFYSLIKLEGWDPIMCFRKHKIQIKVTFGTINMFPTQSINYTIHIYYNFMRVRIMICILHHVLLNPRWCSNRGCYWVAQIPNFMVIGSFSKLNIMVGNVWRM